MGIPLRDERQRRTPGRFAPRKGRRGSVTTALATLTALAALLLPTAAAARAPVITYLEGNQLKQYDSGTDRDLSALPVPIDDPATVRWAISSYGRFVLFTDAEKKLHLFDRLKGQQIALPGIDVYANPGFLSAADNGLVAFDDNANGPARVYDSKAGQFVDTGLAADNGHRQTKLSGNGRFLATTCLLDCIVDLNSDSNPYVQDLNSGTDTGVPDDDNADEEDPCINGDGNLVGWHKSDGAQKDVFIYDRGAGDFLSLPGINDATLDDTFCALSPGGTYVGLMRDNSEFMLYDRTTSSFALLPDRPFSSSSVSNGILSAPFAPCAGRVATLVGTPGRDTLRGTARADVIAGLSGRDLIRGLRGNDVLCGGAGGDRLFGGKGTDRLLGGKGRDLLAGGRGRDRLIGGPGRDVQRQ